MGRGVGTEQKASASLRGRASKSQPLATGPGIAKRATSRVVLSALPTFEFDRRCSRYEQAVEKWSSETEAHQERGAELHDDWTALNENHEALRRQFELSEQNGGSGSAILAEKAEQHIQAFFEHADEVEAWNADEVKFNSRFKTLQVAGDQLAKEKKRRSYKATGVPVTWPQKIAVKDRNALIKLQRVLAGQRASSSSSFSRAQSMFKTTHIPDGEPAANIGKPIFSLMDELWSRLFDGWPPIRTNKY